MSIYLRISSPTFPLQISIDPSPPRSPFSIALPRWLFVVLISDDLSFATPPTSVSTTSTSRATPTALLPRRCNTPELALIDGCGHRIKKDTKLKDN